MVNLFALDRKRVIALVAIGVIVAVLPILIVMLQRQQELRQRASPADSLLSFNPSTASKTVGEQFTTDVIVNGVNGSTAYDISFVESTIAFDKDVLEFVSFTGSPTFNSHLVIPSNPTAVNSSGTFRFVVLNSSPTAITGSDIVAGTITFRGKAQGSGQLTFRNVEVDARGQRTPLSYGTNQPATFTINPANGSPSPSPTDATTTPAATVTLAPTSTPIPGTVISFRVTLPGIGTRSNPSPRRTQRNNVKLELYNASEVKTAEGEGQIVYDRDSGTFRGLIGVGTITPGDYTVKLLVPGYRWQKLGGFVPVTAPTGTYTLAQVTTLHAGDLSGDSDLSIEDFHILTRNCFGEKADLPSCANKNAADLNDDEKVDLVDLNIFIRSFLVLEGD